ncbi:unannotated protein [freshwater metagenome]|uniref:Unannotated protein n=1 Tax=freshwater metagenome TaxID=449393 RepID=A0A6J6GV45_9ZZZZ
MPVGALDCRSATTALVFEAFGTMKKSVSVFRYTIRSSITPPAVLQSIEYCAAPFGILVRSFVSIRLRKSNAPSPTTDALPKCETSKSPTRSRTAACSASTPAPGYSIGINQPPKSAILALRAKCRSCIGDSFMAHNLSLHILVFLL